MRTFFLSAFWCVATLAVLAVSAWFLAFRQGSPPGRVVAPLVAPVEITWIDGMDARINLTAPDDGDLALGVAHGIGRPWLMALYRQAALGRLAEWFGPDLVPLDRHVRQLGIPPADRPLTDDGDALARYSQGVRAAQQTQDWSLLPAAVALGIVPEPWTRRDVVAVERLLTWLAADLASADVSGSESIVAARAQLADFLGLQGLSRGLVWSASGELYARLTTGDSGLPPVMTVSITTPGGLAYEGATLPGLPYRICGRNSSARWCKFPGSRAAVWRDSTVSSLAYAGIEVSDGSRVAVALDIRADGALLEDGLRVHWTGLEATSDAAAWLALPASMAPFQLATATGLVRAPGALHVLGDQVHTGTSVTLTGHAEEAPLLLQRLDAVDDTLQHALALLMDTGTALPAAAQDSLMDQASASYLRNWDGRFEPSSIAASIFDATGAFGRSGLDTLQAWFGADQRIWRWELDPAHLLRYPGAAAAGMPARFGPVDWLRSGHPGAPSWGPSRSWDAGRAYAPSAAWEAYLGPRGVVFRQPEVPYSRFLGRFRSAPVRSPLRRLHSEPPLSTTRIRPAG